MTDTGLTVRIRQIAASLDVAASDLQIQQLETYIRTLSFWNRTINLTALDVESISDLALDRLIREPLSILPWLDRGQAGAWFDLGSGSGSPAVPLRVFLTEADLTMVESRGRKAAFLRDVCTQAGLPRVRVISGRVEDLQTSQDVARLITARAIRLDEGVSKTVRQLLRLGGEIMLFGGTNWDELREFASETRSAEGSTLLNVPRGTSHS